MKLIDKDALVAEIKKHQAIWDGMDDDYCKGQRLAYSDVISFLDTLEVREVREESVSKDLEEAAFDYAEACKYDGGEKLLCVEHFKAGVQWQKQKNAIEVKEVDLELNSFDATVCKIGSTYLKEMDRDAIAKALEPYKDGDKVKVIIKAQKGE